jgi:hypothetical protein
VSRFSIEYISLLKQTLQSDDSRPIIVVGVGRSGTTPLSYALHEHPDIVMTLGHSPMIPWLGKAVYQFFEGQNPRYYQRYTPISCEDFLARFRSLSFDCVWNEEDLLDVTRKKLAQPDPSLDYLGVHRWGTRAYPDEQAASGLARIFPRIVFIHIVRNGLEVVHSMSKYKAYRHLDFKARCHFWADRIVRDRFLSARSDCLSIRFEDLLEQPERTMSEVLKFSGLRASDIPSCFLKEYLVHPLGGPSVAANPLTIHRKRPAAYSTWTEDEKEMFRSICGTAMRLQQYPIPF